MNLLDIDLERLDEQTLRQRLENGLHENDQVEFKAEWTSLKSGQFLKVVTGFANGAGGDLLIGIDDDRNIAPVERHDLQQAVDRFTNMVETGTDPVLRGLAFRIVAIGAERAILVVRVPSSREAPHMVTLDQNRFYHRVASASLPMRTSDIRAAIVEALRRAGGVVAETVQARLARLSERERALLLELARGSDPGAAYGGVMDSCALPPSLQPAADLLEAAKGLDEKNYAHLRLMTGRWVSSLNARGFLLAQLAMDERAMRAALLRVHQALVRAPTGPADKLRALCLGAVPLTTIHAALECWALGGHLSLQLVDGGGMERTRVFGVTQELNQARADELLATLGVP